MSRRFLIISFIFLSSLQSLCAATVTFPFNNQWNSCWMNATLQPMIKALDGVDLDVFVSKTRTPGQKAFKALSRLCKMLRQPEYVNKKDSWFIDRQKKQYASYIDIVDSYHHDFRKAIAYKFKDGKTGFVEEFLPFLFTLFSTQDTELSDRFKLIYTTKKQGVFTLDKERFFLSLPNGFEKNEPVTLRSKLKRFFSVSRKKHEGQGIKKLPEIFIIRNVGKNTKFPLRNLNMFPFVHNDFLDENYYGLYDLFAMIMIKTCRKKGQNKKELGHGYAYVKDVFGQWCYTNSTPIYGPSDSDRMIMKIKQSLDGTKGVVQKIYKKYMYKISQQKREQGRVAFLFYRQVADQLCYT